MKFKEFLIKEGVTPSIDDSDVLNTLDDAGITYTRTKSDRGDLMYTFDNRYSIKYDGSTFILYRSENKVHLANARNKSEIGKAISTWNGSYSLSTTEISDDDVEDIVAKMKSDAAAEETSGGDDESKPEDETANDEKESDEPDDKKSNDDFYSTFDNNNDDTKEGDKK